MAFPKIFQRAQKTEVTVNQKSYRIQVGEYLPWKGFMFKITKVDEQGFSAEVSGVTKKLSHLVGKEG